MTNSELLNFLRNLSYLDNNNTFANQTQILQAQEAIDALDAIRDRVNNPSLIDIIIHQINFYLDREPKENYGIAFRLSYFQPIIDYLNRQGVPITDVMISPENAPVARQEDAACTSEKLCNYTSKGIASMGVLALNSVCSSPYIRLLNPTLSGLISIIKNKCFKKPNIIRNASEDASIAFFCAMVAEPLRIEFGSDCNMWVLLIMLITFVIVTIVHSQTFRRFWGRDPGAI